MLGRPRGPAPIRRPHSRPRPRRTAAARGDPHPVPPRWAPGSLLRPVGAGLRPPPNSYALGLAIQRDDKIVVARRSGGLENPRFTVLRYPPNGRPDAGFGAGGALVRRVGDRSEATSALMQPDGRVVVAGNSVKVGAAGGVRSIVLERFAP